MTIRKDLLGFLQVLVEEKENEGVKKGDKEEENEEKVEEKVEEADEKGKVGYKGGEKVEDNKEEGLIDKGEREQENDMAEGKDNDFDNVTGNQYEYSCQNCKAGKTHFDCKYCEEVLPKGLKVSETEVVILEYHKSKVSLYTAADQNECANIVFSTGPWDMTKVETNILAVTLPHEKKVKFLHVDDRIEEADEITTPGFCKCIASICNYLVVTFTEPAGLKLLSKSGEVLRDVQMTEAGKTLFSLPSSVVVADRNIFVTDPLMNTVTRMDSDGKIEEILRHKDLIGPLSIAYSDEQLTVSLCNGTKFLTMTCDFENIEVDSTSDFGLIGSIRMIKDGTEPVSVCGIFIIDEEEEEDDDSEEEEEEDDDDEEEEEEEEEDDDHRKGSFSYRDEVWKSSDVVEYKPRESMRRKKSKKECTVS